MLGTLVLLLFSGSASAEWGDASLTAEVSPIDFFYGHIFGMAYEQQVGISEHSISAGVNVGELFDKVYIESTVAWRMYPIGSFRTGMPVGATLETVQYPVGAGREVVEDFRTTIAGIAGWKVTLDNSVCLRVEVGPALDLWHDGDITVNLRQSLHVGRTF